jgi:hypothetical protein
MLALPGALAAVHRPNVGEFITLRVTAASVSFGYCCREPDSQLPICALRARRA